jgi:hypothetical protein
VHEDARAHVLLVHDQDPLRRDLDVLEYRVAFRHQRRPLRELGIRVARDHQFPVGRALVCANVNAVTSELRLRFVLVAGPDRSRIGIRADRPDAYRVGPERARLEHGDVRVVGFGDAAHLLRVFQRDEENVGRGIGAEPMPVAALRLRVTAGIALDRIEQQYVAPVEPRVELRLRFALQRSQKELAIPS